MPRLVDPRPRSADDHNPLANLLDFDSIDQTVLTMGTALQQFFSQLVEAALDGVIEFIKDLTGIDLSSFADLLTGLFDFTGIDLTNFTSLFGGIFGASGIDLSSFTNLFGGIFGETGLDIPGLGALDPLTLFAQLFSFLPGLGDGGINPVDFITDILNPTGLLATIAGIVEAITGGVGGLSDITDFFTNLFGVFGGATDLAGFTSFFTDFFGILSGGAFTGTGDPLSFILDFFDEIPLIGPLIEAITGSVGGLSDLTSFFTDFFGIFGGAGGLGDAGNFFTNILSLLGDPSGLLGSPGGFDLSGALEGLPIIGTLVEAITGSIGGLGDLTSFFAGIPIIGDLVEAITGSSGGLGDLTSFFAGLVPLDQLVEALTGNLGDLDDLVSWVNDIPILGDLVEALTGGSGGLFDLTSWAGNLVPLNLFDDLLSGLGGSFGDSIADIIDRLDDMLTPASAIPGGNIIGEIVDDVIPGIGGILSGIFGALTGHTGTAASHSEATAALVAQNAALQGVAAQVALLNTAFTSGVSASDDFERSDSDDLGTGWSVAYAGSSSGNIYIDGHNAAWKAASLTAATRTVRALFLGTTSSTDYQRVEMILNSAPLNPLLLGGPAGSPAANDIILRADSGSTNYIRIRFRADGVCLISRFVSGTETVMNSATIPFDMAGGVTLTGEAGKLGTARYFRGLINGSPACEVTEAGTASLVGSSYRGWGLGMFAGADNRLIIVPAQAKPGSIKQWTAADQVL